jgi:PPM family protein phosphatase
VEEMSIGEFARRSRLSPKALRVYDGLGLLSPARVDELSGYRYYEEAQLEQARLIAALRGVGVPLVTVKELLALEPADARPSHWPGASRPANATDRYQGMFTADNSKMRPNRHDDGYLCTLRCA